LERCLDDSSSLSADPERSVATNNFSVTPQEETRFVVR
jgi:hypothetical protein